jgi:hypothetical protein
MTRVVPTLWIVLIAIVGMPTPGAAADPEAAAFRRANELNYYLQTRRTCGAWLGEPL